MGYERRVLYTALGAFGTMFLIGSAATITRHAPAGATTLIVSLDILPLLRDFIALMVAVTALTLVGLLINRGFKIEYPFWHPKAKLFSGRR